MKTIFKLEWNHTSTGLFLSTISGVVAGVLDSLGLFGSKTVQ